jgi:osmotically inducible protein OsmC
MATRRATATWNGDLAGGNGKAELESGVAGSLDVNWRARTEGGVQTSPEELLAAAHAACFSMALSHELSQAGHEPTRLSVAAAVNFDAVPEGFAVTQSRLKVRGVVPGIDQEAFEQFAQGAGEGCPISGALKGNVDIAVEEAVLEDA